jgi:uncharacterized protein
MRFPKQKYMGLRRSLASLAASGLILLSQAVYAYQPGELPNLTLLPGAPHLPGKFVWADLVTDDLGTAQKFYSGLFGWRFLDYGGYFIGTCDEAPVCGMFQRPRPADKEAKPRWFAYMSVSSLSKAAKAVQKAGGKVLAAPKKFPGRGEQAVFADPEGALFGVIKSSSGDPPDSKADIGEWIWIQLMSRDAQKAAEFYRGIGGYEIVENTVTNRLSDYVLASKGYARGTVRTIPAKYQDVRPSWLLFVRVKNAAETVAKAKELGGKVLIEPSRELHDGKVAVVADPTGAAVGLLQWDDQPGK